MNVATAQDQGEGLKTGNGTSLATQMRTLVEQCEYAPPFCLTLLYPALITINHPFPIHSWKIWYSSSQVPPDFCNSTQTLDIVSLCNQYVDNYQVVGSNTTQTIGMACEAVTSSTGLLNLGSILHDLCGGCKHLSISDCSPKMCTLMLFFSPCVSWRWCVHVTDWKYVQYLSYRHSNSESSPSSFFRLQLPFNPRWCCARQYDVQIEFLPNGFLHCQ